MTQFALNNWTPAKCKHVAKREENHGDDLVDAMTVHYRIEFTNDRLDEWFPGLRHALYKAKDTHTIAGLPEVTPDKRTDLVESPLNLKTELAGYMLYMRRGAGHSKPLQIEWAGADAKDFKLDPKAGGICTLEFKVNVSGLDEEALGRLASMGGREVEIMFVPPKLQDGTLPDGHQQQPKGKAKPTSSKQMRIPDAEEGAGPSKGEKPPAGRAAEPQADDVNPFRFSVRGGVMVDNNPDAGSPFVVGDPPSATELFLDAHAPADDEFPDDGSDDTDDGVDAYGEELAASTGLADDVAPERSVKKGTAISGKRTKE